MNKLVALLILSIILLTNNVNAQSSNYSIGNLLNTSPRTWSAATNEFKRGFVIAYALGIIHTAPTNDEQQKLIDFFYKINPDTIIKYINEMFEIEANQNLSSIEIYDLYVRHHYPKYLELNKKKPNN